MKAIIKYIFQDWEVNKQGSAKSRLVMLMFRATQILGRLPVFSVFFRNFYTLVVEWILGIELPWDTQVGANLKLLHGVGLVVNHETIIGANCTLRHATTIGNKKLPDGSYSASPKIGNNVEIGSNAVIIGPITVGNNAVIGAGAVVIKDVPSGAVVAGNPAKVIRITGIEESGTVEEIGLRSQEQSRRQESGDKSQKPKVSIVTPAYNSMKYLPATLESILQQTFTDFEVLIVNDGSTDNIVQWAAEIADPRVKLLSQVNQGLSAARNTGIAHAQADFIAFVDADDLWEPTKLEKQVRCLDENPEVGLVHTWMALVDEQGKFTGRVLKSSVEGHAWEQLVQWNRIACPSVIVRRCCFDAVGVFDQSLRSVEDWDMWLRIATSYPFAVINEPLAYYRQVPNSMSKNCQVMEQSFHQVIEKTFQSAPEELLYLKNRSYSYAYLCLGWKALQSTNRDYKLANNYRAQAFAHNPQIRFSSEYMRLSLAVMALQLFGTNGYSRVLELAYTLRRRISNFT